MLYHPNSSQGGQSSCLEVGDSFFVLFLEDYQKVNKETEFICSAGLSSYPLLKVINYV